MHLRTIAFRGLRKLELNSGQPPGQLTPMLDGHELRAVNLIIGPNGGGKSTVADMVRSLGEVDVLSTLVRENIRLDTHSGFRLVFDSGAECRLTFNKTDIDEAEVTVLIGFPPLFDTHWASIDLRRREPVPEKLRASLASLGVSVHYRNRHDEADVPLETWLDQLNAHAAHLIGVGDYPLVPGQPAYTAPPGWSTPRLPPLLPRDADTLSIRFNDDSLQNNHVRIAALPSGWRAFGGLLAWLATRPEHSICVVEEPETHLHPTLQRALIREVVRIAGERHVQVFMTTHSAAMIDFAVPQPSVRLFEANGWQFRALSEPATAVQALGVRPSDLCLANGLVWVEGPSDRLYLLHWLALWCEQNGHSMPVENVDFAFAYYSGALLRHYSAMPADTLIAIFGINPNAFLLMDRDLDFASGPDGFDVPVDMKGTKARILAEMRSHGSASRQPWVTSGYTIESYLPDVFRNRNFRTEGERLVPLSRGSKVETAHAFTRMCHTFDKSYASDGLPKLIEALYCTIRHWQR